MRFKLTFITFSVIILMLLQPVAGQGRASRIQIDDQWEYQDSKGNNYNEVTRSELEYKRGNSLSSLVEVETARPHDFGYYQIYSQDNITMITDLTPTTNRLLMTDNGGIPVFSNSTVRGTVEVLNGTEQIFLEFFEDIQLSVDYVGEPARVLATGESEIWQTSWLASQENAGVTISASMRYEYLMSSNSLPNDRIFNSTNTVIRFWFVTNYYGPDRDASFTMTYDQEEGLVVNLEVSESNSLSTYSAHHRADGLSLSQAGVSQSAFEVSWDSDHKIPVYIGQTQPVKLETDDSLSLSQFASTELVEFELVTEDSSVTSGSEAGFIYGFLAFNVILATTMLLWAKRRSKNI